MKLKHPRTPHVPNSPGVGKDDKVLDSLEHFSKMDSVIVSIKLDGEAFTGYANGQTHARSVDSNNHPSRDWSKAYWGSVFMNLPNGWRVQCENVYATHSIHYKNLDHYLYGIVIWDENNIALSWDDSQEWFALLGIPPVPIFFHGKFDYKLIERAFKVRVALEKQDDPTNETEGFVIRNAGSFHWEDFGDNSAKWVRESHVQTDEHWLEKPVVPNLRRKS